jgi:recombination protein RecR
MFDGVIADLIEQLGRLPGIGPKSAQRIAFFVVQNPSYDPGELATILGSIRDQILFCESCGMLATAPKCEICEDPRRDDRVICVVEDTKDVWAIERTREYRGRYHVLGGSLSPMDGVGPEQLRITELISRLSDGHVNEVIIATDPNLEGEATASYLSRLLTQPNLSVTRLASGLPVGGDLEYADEVTLSRAFAGRRHI